jgi:hypothetical protein
MTAMIFTSFFGLSLKAFTEKSGCMLGVSSPWPSDPDIEDLVNRANGSFLSMIKIVEDIQDPCDRPN